MKLVSPSSEWEFFAEYDAYVLRRTGDGWTKLALRENPIVHICTKDKDNGNFVLTFKKKKLALSFCDLEELRNALNALAVAEPEFFDQVVAYKKEDAKW